MRWLALLLLPLALQLIGYLVVLSATTGNGSFVGLLLIPLALLATPLLLVVGIVSCLKLPADRPIGRRLALQWLLALGPALVLLVMQALVS